MFSNGVSLCIEVYCSNAGRTGFCEWVDVHADSRGRQGAGQEQWTHPVAGHFRQQSSQQHILDTYVG